MAHRKTIIACLILAIVFTGSICVYALPFSSVNKRADYRYGSFWEDPGKYDVWFLGSSHIYYSIQPMRLYKDYGYTSYDIAVPSATIPMSYWLMINALEKGTPRLIVVDTYHLRMNEKTTSMKDKLHMSLDRIPYSDMKYRAIKDLLPEKDRKEFLFQIYTRDKLEEMKKFKEDQTLKYPLMKGAKIATNSIDLSRNKITDKNKILKEPTTGSIYLEKIISECDKRGIDLVITAFPYAGRQDEQKGLHTAMQIAEKHGIKHIDLQYCPKLLDYKTDFCEDGHLNCMGSNKLTDYMGKYICSHCDLPDHRNRAGYDIWNREAEEATRFVNKSIAKMQKHTNRR